MVHRDDGGMVPSSPGLAPSASNQQPNIQGIIQRFSGMAPEQLQELIPRLPGQMQQIAQRVLQQKHMAPQQQQSQQQPTPAMPQFGVPTQPQAIQQPPPVQTQAKGGQVRFAAGGGMQPTGHHQHSGMRPKETVPILAAGGEFVVSPEWAAHLGRGDHKAGHKWLDEFVIAKRKEIISDMARLKPPVGSKK